MTARVIVRSLCMLLTIAFLAATATATPPDLTKEPTLYVVGYAHLDTQWRWEYPRTIGEFLPKTLHDNFALFEKYPHYIFNFSGANRYRMMKQYYPADYETLKKYVAAGRWFPAGSSMEESDVNSPSAESIIRQVLYGNHYFRRDFGVASAEYMLPDCFGFPASLPSILAHMGIKGFSTQKLTWGSAVGILFNVGVWEGPDGGSVIAAFNPGDYSGDIMYDLSKSEPPPNARNYIDWPARVRQDGQQSGVYTDYHYYGTGDTGGAPRESSVSLLESIVTKNDGSLHVVWPITMDHAWMRPPARVRCSASTSSTFAIAASVLCAYFAGSGGRSHTQRPTRARMPISSNPSTTASTCHMVPASRKLVVPDFSISAAASWAEIRSSLSVCAA